MWLFHFLLRNEHGHAGALGIIVLLGNIQHLGADGVGYLLENAGEPLRTVLFVNIGDILFPLLFRAGIAHIIHVEAESLRQVVETVKLKLTPFHEVN